MFNILAKLLLLTDFFSRFCRHRHKVFFFDRIGMFIVEFVMKASFLYLLFLFFPLVSLGAGEGSQEVPPLPVRVGVQLFARPNQTLLAVNFKNHPGWHTYWKNPGDAGLPPRIQITLNDKKIDLSSLEWPIPRKFIEKGNIVAYGYEGAYTLFFELPTGFFEKYRNRELKFLAKWLVCRHVCIPGKLKTSIKFGERGIVAKGLTLEKVDEKILFERFKALPIEREHPSELEITLRSQGDGLVLDYRLAVRIPPDFKVFENLLIPFPHALLGFKHEQLFFDRKRYLYGQMPLDWEGEYAEPEVSLPANGRFDPRPLQLSFLYRDPLTGKVGIIKKAFHTFKQNVKQRESFYHFLVPAETKDLTKASSLENPVSPLKEKTWIYLLFAFLGGLLLNVMPCVLPVISLKLFGLINVRNRDPMAILKHNLVYTAGVLTTFGILGLCIVILKLAGQGVGWGFHLQSTHFVITMIIILLILALNLFGLFEFKTPGGKVLGGFNPRRGLSGDFLSGVLATALSTPCSAPFLGTALTFAFTTSTWVLFLVFFLIGMGLSFPFILTAFVPGLIHLLPRPGMWMEHFKKFLGLTLILTIIWLMDVLMTLVDSSHMIAQVSLALVLIFFAFYLQKHITQNKALRTVAFLIPILVVLSIMLNISSSEEGVDRLLQDKSKDGLNWERWSVEKMEEYRRSGDRVFISFTAEWCLTCKANERLVIHTKAFKEVVDKHRLKLLLGDYTKRNKSISNFLRQNGLFGIPAYFIQKSDGTLINLRETISVGKVKQHLE